ncbi:uncharacterized protein ATC70_012629 [Mucor velutinosus]|uniref:Uncharacterized protein n=1 Tax=Mucor velutinosus TaxID=708070 RepID=A0AAN7HKM6_9FUNG|nr:hypothetical protein ATC70_012629 [Mucor velutinosus]
MEAFLTTLPPYVHEFLDRYPPTDVFNLLRELICFAVLYSEDRDKLNQSTSDFLKKRQQSENKDQHEFENDDITQKEEEEEEDVTVPVEKRIDPIAEESEHEIQALKAKPLYNIRTGETIQTDKSNMPNTFPEWWGHRESEPHKVERKETTIQHGEHEDKTLPQSFGTSWISWENQQPTSTPTTTHHRMERARSQIIPDLRSYLVEDSKLTPSRTAPSSNSSSAAASSKKKCSLNTTHTKAIAAGSPPNVSNSKAVVAKPKRRTSSPPVCDSPVATVAPAPPSSKFVQTAAKQQQLRQNKTASPSSSGTSTAPPTRSASVILKQPRQNAAMRARAEHARQQQEELERKKNAPAIGSSTSLRLKQRVNSGIDWESIKRDRRKTVAEAPSSSASSKE